MHELYHEENDCEIDYDHGDNHESDYDHVLETEHGGGYHDHDHDVVAVVIVGDQLPQHSQMLAPWGNWVNVYNPCHNHDLVGVHRCDVKVHWWVVVEVAVDAPCDVLV